jgi:hypothetical protein
MAFIFWTTLSTSFLSISARAQAPVNYKFFDQFPSVKIPTPEVARIQPVIVYNNSTSKPNTVNAATDYFQRQNIAIEEQNRRVLQQQNLLPGPGGAGQVSQQAQMERELMEDEFYRKNAEHAIATRSYQQAFKDMAGLNPDHFSIIRAQYDIENAYLEGALPYDQFVHAIQLRAIHVKQILKGEGISTKSNLALNYGIQQLYQRPNFFFDSIHHTTIIVPPFSYQFEDYKGEKDYENIFTEKLMRTGKGQCLSMPRLYLMIAEQLGAKAWLALAPQHSFIQFADSKGKLLNFETTNGNLASSSWLAGSGFINAKAVKSKSYLDTLSQRQLYAECLSELLLGYLQKYDYDDLAEQMKLKILQADPYNLRGWIIDAGIKRRIAFQKIMAAGKPKEADLHNFPDAYKAYLDMKAAMDKVDDLGYQDMPAEAYQAWLKSIEQEKKKQASRELNGRLQQEINQLKRLKSTLKPSQIN